MRNVSGNGLPVNLIMIGPPGAGKGTQAETIARKRGVPKISTGDILREAIHEGSELGLRAKAIVDRGDLVGDDVMIGIVQERLNRPDALRGFVLDGFPRTIPQAKALDAMLASRGPLVVVEMVVPHDELVRRMAGRRICDSCGATADPSDAKCHQCGGGDLVHRSDDGEASIREKRLDVFAQQTEPIIRYYKSRETFRSINGAQPPECVARDMDTAIDSALETAGSSR
jgi:adenylate kinase